MNVAHDSRPAVTKRAAIAGAQLAFEHFRTDIATETKANKTDVVTQADRDAQHRVVDVISETYPGETIVGEENDARKTVPNEGATWIIDPIDGTNNFVDGIRVWGTAVACVVNGEPVAAAVALPALGDTYTADRTTAYLNGDEISVSDIADPELATVSPTLWWEFTDREAYAAATREIVTRFDDLRRFGSAQATLALVAGGSLEGTLSNLQANPWDSVAGVHLVRQAGGTVTDTTGDRWRHDSTGLVVSNGALHESVLAATQAIEHTEQQ